MERCARRSAPTARGARYVPAVINLECRRPDGEFHIKTAYIEGVPHIAVKVASGFYDNPAKGPAERIRTDGGLHAATGLPAALLLDNGFLTDIRTGAAGAVAADLLAPASIDVVGVARIRRAGALPDPLSAGRALVHAHRRLEPDTGASRRLLRRHAAAAATTPPRPQTWKRSAVKRTSSSRRRRRAQPMVDADWLRAGQHITAVGSDSPESRSSRPPVWIGRISSSSIGSRSAPRSAS